MTDAEGSGREARAAAATHRLMDRVGLSGAAALGPAERVGRYARVRLAGGLDVWCRPWGARWAVVVRHGERGVRHVYPDLDTAELHLPGLRAHNAT